MESTAGRSDFENANEIRGNLDRLGELAGKGNALFSNLIAVGPRFLLLLVSKRAPPRPSSLVPVSSCPPGPPFAVFLETGSPVRGCFHACRYTCTHVHVCVRGCSGSDRRFCNSPVGERVASLKNKKIRRGSRRTTVRFSVRELSREIGLEGPIDTRANRRDERTKAPSCENILLDHLSLFIKLTGKPVFDI